MIISIYEVVHVPFLVFSPVAFGGRVSDLLGSLADTLRDEWFADARIIDLNSEWYAYMLVQGFDFAGSRGEGPADAFELAVSTRIDGTIYVSEADEGAADMPVDAKSLTGAESERGVAIADFTCRQETDYMNRALEIRIVRDYEFINQHSKELQELENVARGW